MLKCPYCNESIGSNFKSCPLCMHQFTASEIKQMKAEATENQRDNQKEILDKVEKARIRRGIFDTVTVILMVLIVLISLLMANYDLVDFETPFIVAIVIGVIIYAILYFCTDIYRCPHCGHHLYKNGGKCCRMCGGRIR